MNSTETLQKIEALRAEREVVNAAVERGKLRARALSAQITALESSLPRDKRGNVIMKAEPARIGASGK